MKCGECLDWLTDGLSPSQDGVCFVLLFVKHFTELQRILLAGWRHSISRTLIYVQSMCQEMDCVGRYFVCM